MLESELHLNFQPCVSASLRVKLTSTDMQTLLQQMVDKAIKKLDTFCFRL